MPEPILIDCEGGGHPGHLLDDGRMRCAACTHTTDPKYDAASDGIVPEHQRQDLVAMVARGDFDV